MVHWMSVQMKYPCGRLADLPVLVLSTPTNSVTTFANLQTRFHQEQLYLMLQVACSHAVPS